MSAEGGSGFSAAHLSPILAHGKARSHLSHELLTWMLQLAGRRAVTSAHTHIASCRRITTDSQASRVPHSTPPWKEPVRGGQNLSQRYERLEKSLRGKEAYGKEIQQLTQKSGTIQSPAEARRGGGARTFMGFVVPEEPKPPGPDGVSSSFRGYYTKE